MISKLKRGGCARNRRIQTEGKHNLTGLCRLVNDQGIVSGRVVQRQALTHAGNAYAPNRTGQFIGAVAMMHAEKELSLYYRQRDFHPRGSEAGIYAVLEGALD